MPALRRRALAVALATVAAALPAAAQTRYLAFGDSITLGVDIDDCPCNCAAACGYPWRLENRLDNAGLPATIVNAGLGGERTTQGLTRLDELLADGDYDVLLLMEGTNDITREISLETTVFNLAEMARKAAEDGADTLHATLIPRFPEADVDAENVQNALLAERIRELAATEGRKLADPFEVFGQQPNLFDDFYAEIEGDPVGHPNPDGISLLTGVFFDVIAGLDRVPPVLGFVDPADGAEHVPAWPEIRVRLYDFGAGVDVAGTSMLIDGQVVPALASGDPAALDLSYAPAAPLAGEVTVRVVTRDLASPSHGWSRPVSTFLVANGSSTELSDAQVQADRDRVEDVRKRLAVDAPGTLHPTVTLLAPSRSGGVAGSTHVTQHDAQGTGSAAPETRLVWAAQHAGQASRLAFDYQPLATLFRVDSASDLVAAGAPGELRLSLANGLGGVARIDNVGGGPATIASGNVEPALLSTHENVLSARDFLVFDLLHEVLTVQLCDNVSGPATTCYDAFVEIGRRPDPDRYQMKIGCLDGSCGEVLMNLRTTFDGTGRLAGGVAELILDDERFTLTRELVVWFKKPAEPGELWVPNALVIVDNQGNHGTALPSFATLYQNAHPSHLDPAAD